MIKLRFASLEYTPSGAVTHFDDGSQWGALPHDEPHYHHLAFALGYGGDILAYCREHEHAHHLVAEEFGHPSRVIWALAHGDDPKAEEAAAEEALAITLQRYARTNEPPLIEGLDWEQLKCRLLLAEEVA